MMRFLSIYKTAETNTPPSLEHVTRMGALIEEFTRTGALIATEGCLPSATGARVRQSGGNVTVTDGPFTESKEVIGGFALLQANSMEEMIALTRKFLSVAGDGECEIRQLYTAPAAAPGDARTHHERLTEQFTRG
jgi:hypothetical protein